MSKNYSLIHLNVSIHVGRIKHKNKNPVAKKAVRELEEELIRQETGGRPICEVGLAPATARLTSRELWTQRNQFTHEQLPTPILNLSSPNMNTVPLTTPSARKNPCGLVPNSPPPQVVDLV